MSAKRRAIDGDGDGGDDSKNHDAKALAVSSGLGRPTERKVEQSDLEPDELTVLRMRLLPATPLEVRTDRVVMTLASDGSVWTQHTETAHPNRRNEMGGRPYCHCGVPTCAPDRKPIRLIKDDVAVVVAVGKTSEALFAMTRDTLFAWGAGQNAELPNGSALAVCPVPTVVLKLPSSATTTPSPCPVFIQLVLGWRSGAVLTSAGQLYTWGMSWGPTGHCGDGEIARPTVPPALRSVRVVAAALVSLSAYDGLVVVCHDGTALRSGKLAWSALPHAEAIRLIYAHI